MVTELQREIENHLLPAVYVAGKPKVHYQLAERMRHYHVPALSLALVQEGQISLTAAFGSKLAGHDALVDAATLFQAASVSKPIAALAALALVQQGRLNLDEDVNQRLERWHVPAHPQFENAPVTLRRLLSHSAGLSVHGFPRLCGR